MALKAQLAGVQTTDGMIYPTALIVHLATTIPAVRDMVVAGLIANGHLAEIGVAAVPTAGQEVQVPWYRRLFSRKAQQAGA